MSRFALLSLFIAMLMVAVPVLAQADAPVQVGGNDELGAFLVDADGMTLYIFLNDTPNTSNCEGDCLEAWPALTVESADDLADLDLPGNFGVTEREDTGDLQVTYNRLPLYYFAQDAAAGDTNGQGRGDVWFVARPQLLGMGSNEELGGFLVDRAGMTLYMFTNDEEGSSACTGECLENWPAFTAANEDELVAGLEVAASDELGVLEREDTGELQVTFNGAPLYYFAQDAEPGDATGQGRGDVWFVVQPEILAVDDSGNLIGPDNMTLYTFANDEEGTSACYDQCAVAWPSLTVASEDNLIAAEDITGDLGTIEREDGSLQVTYNGAPLYYFFRDAEPGDTNGDGVNDVWFIATVE